jgi:hypothetical protein
MASVRPTAQPLPDGLRALLRQLVVESLQGGGARPEMIFVAADSASAKLLRLADVPAVVAPGPGPLLCPGSTEADGRPTAPPVGYVVQATLGTLADSMTRRLRVTKSCFYRYRGGGRPYAEGGAWDLRREDGRWRVVAAFDLGET